MERTDPETGALRPEQVGEIERCLARGWSWGVLTRLCNRRWGTDYRAAALKKEYTRCRADAERERMRSRREYYAAALEEGEE